MHAYAYARAQICVSARACGWFCIGMGQVSEGGLGDMGPSAAPHRAVAQVAAGGEKIGVVVADFTGNRQGSVASLEASHAHVRPHMTCLRARMHTTGSTPFESASALLLSRMRSEAHATAHCKRALILWSWVLIIPWRVPLIV
jgi:hypothetical protein